ncbi:MAG: 16S rRNA (guanine(966)-N(2))-methyltransferase RsmD [Trueperella sp.]|nr:16S rRNA (guanine(966)-N(2))-methyltransferase RsmD [Trueperella sp.]
MTRIVSGSAGGLTIAVPKAGTRPTSERVREALFSRFEHLGYLADGAVLDLYAGSGALGLEAASRGARRVVCVEAARSAAQIIAQNAKYTGLPITVVTQKVLNFLSEEPREKFDLVLLDPPYDIAEAELTLVLAALPAHLTPDALVAVERNKKSPHPQWPAELEFHDERKWGDTRVWSAFNRVSR